MKLEFVRRCQRFYRFIFFYCSTLSYREEESARRRIASPISSSYNTSMVGIGKTLNHFAKQ